MSLFYERLPTWAACVLGITLILGPISTPAEQTFFRSNVMGFALQEIVSPGMPDLPYVLVVRKDERREVKTLYTNGREVERWEVAYRDNGTKYEERNFRLKLLAVLRVYDSSGRLLEEKEYNAGGLEQTTRYVYTVRGGLLEKEVTGADGDNVYREYYSLSTENRLRRVTRRWADGTTHVSSYVIGDGKLQEETHESGAETLILHYDLSGRLVNKEVWRTHLFRRWQFEYSQSGNLVFAKEEDFAEGKQFLRDYDDAGRIVKERTVQAGQIVQTVEYYWNPNGEQERVRTSSAGGIWETFFAYAQDGRLVKETVMNRGVVEKIIEYDSDETRIEAMYREGKLFMKVFLRGDEREREQFYMDGKLIREKDLRKSR